MEVSLQAHRPLTCRTVFQERRSNLNLKLKPLAGFCPHGRVSHFSEENLSALFVHWAMSISKYAFFFFLFWYFYVTLSCLVLILIKPIKFVFQLSRIVGLLVFLVQIWVLGTFKSLFCWVTDWRFFCKV